MFKVFNVPSVARTCSIVPQQDIVQIFIDKISSLSCQKVVYSITSSNMCGNAAKQTSVLLRNTSEYIRLMRHYIARYNFL